MTPVVDVPRGFQAGAWRVGEHIASGSWGSVYAASGEDGTEAALKFIAGDLLSPSQYAQLEEARFNEQADHPLLVRTFETFVASRRWRRSSSRWSAASATSGTRSATSIPSR